jgi:flavin reductase
MLHGLDPFPPAEPLTPDQFKAAMRKLAAAVTLITVFGPGGRNGLTATAVCSLSCVNRGASAFATLTATRVFAVNVLRPEQRVLAENFHRLPSGEARFAEGDWRWSPQGLPVLADALTWFECRVAEVVPAATHGIVIGQVTACASGPGDHLLYAEGGYHALTRPK